MPGEWRTGTWKCEPWWWPEKRVGGYQGYPAMLNKAPALQLVPKEGTVAPPSPTPWRRPHVLARAGIRSKEG